MNISENTLISHTSKLTLLNPEAGLPTEISTPLDGQEIGWLHADGEAFARSQTVNNIRAHQNDTIVRSSITDGEITFSATALEDKALTRSLFWGATEENGTLTVNPSAALEGTFVYDTFDTQTGFQKAIRYVFTGLVTANGDITYSSADIASYPLLVTVRGNLTIITTPEAVTPEPEPEV